MSETKNLHFSTRAVHAGVAKDESFNSVTTPIYPSSTFRFDKVGVTRGGFDYTRTGNPTRRAAEENIASLEGGVSGHCTATGMAACAAVLHLLKSGDHVITGHDIYGGTYRLMSTLFSGLGVEFSFVDMTRVENVRAAVRSNTKMIWVETPSNPILRIVDLKAVADIARSIGAISVADNTFLSPYFQRPIELGIDIVLHSTTKYINGHSDVVGGAIVCVDAALGQEVGFRVNALGLGEAPFDAWLVLRGVKTLGLRMERHQENAFRVAEYLAGRPEVKEVYYPGLENHPQHQLAKTQMYGFGGMVSFEMDLDQVDYEPFFSNLKLYSLAESLGGVESLIEPPWFMSHVSMPEDARRGAGITPGTVRISLGIEDPDDLVADLAQGFAVGRKLGAAAL